MSCDGATSRGLRLYHREARAVTKPPALVWTCLV